MATASTPFITPLLCVVARYGSTTASAPAAMIASRTCSPARVFVASASTGSTMRADASARSDRLDRMRISTRPSVMFSTSVATPSHMVFTRLAPIASRVSTSRCTTSMSRPPSGAGCTYTSTSTAPPPRATILGCSELARSRISSLRCSTAAWARAGSLTPSTWIWPTRMGSVADAVKPPAARAILAADDSAATIDGSSTTMGMTYSWLLMRKFMARPMGRPITPITFSIILSARARSSTCSPRPRVWNSDSVIRPSRSSAPSRPGTSIL